MHFNHKLQNDNYDFLRNISNFKEFQTVRAVRGAREESHTFLKGTFLVEPLAISVPIISLSKSYPPSPYPQLRKPRSVIFYFLSSSAKNYFLNFTVMTPPPSPTFGDWSGGIIRVTYFDKMSYHGDRIKIKIGMVNILQPCVVYVWPHLLYYVLIIIYQIKRL